MQQDDSKNSSKGAAYFATLGGIHGDTGNVVDKYPRMRSLLERVCKDLTADESIRFEGLYARLDHVCVRRGFTGSRKYRLHTLRINANKVLHEGLVPDDNTYLQDLKVFCEAIGHFYGAPIPPELSAAYSAATPPVRSSKPGQKIPLLRVVVSSVEPEWIHVYEEGAHAEPRQVRYGIEKNREFNETIGRIKEGTTLNLVDIEIDDQGYLRPSMIVLEPDFLLDISSVAECVKEHGAHELNFVLNQYTPRKANPALLLGNIANLFFDEVVTNNGGPRNYAELIRECFTSDPIAFSTCDGIDEGFFNQTTEQYQNITTAVAGLGINHEDVVVEPSFICEQLGLQGRLDFLRAGDGQGRPWVVIELKSGRAPWPEDNVDLIGANHRTQAFLYQILLREVLRAVLDRIETFIFYSRYPHANMRKAKATIRRIQPALNIRNLIVADMMEVGRDGTGTRSRELTQRVTPQVLISPPYRQQRFVQEYVTPPIEEFGTFFQNASVREQEYFHVFNSFIAREHWLSKAGDPEHGAMRSMSALWRTPWEAKTEAGDMLTGLKIDRLHNEMIELSFDGALGGQHAFRQGDIVILYERNTEEDSVVNKRVFKGSIKKIGGDSLTVALRGTQPGGSAFPMDSTYALEHDHMDAGFVAMYRGLYAMLRANQDRRDLLLRQNERLPQFDERVHLNWDHADNWEAGGDALNEIILNAKRAKDFYLLKGPPGTGKTSIVLKSMVKEFLTEPGANILLIAYTNRAVDEICAALTSIVPRPGFIRIGSELSCEEGYHPSLLQNVIAGANNRDEVRERIADHRIFVGTLASLSSRTDLFLLKHFHVAIVDEATQIIEPAILGLLSAKDRDGGNAIDKFILIGDQRQLPAVVLQSAEQARIESEELRQMGIDDLRCSLFERLLESNPSQEVLGALTKQGRMHPELAFFPNHAFYNGELEEVPTPHQQQALECEPPFDSVHHQLVATKRLAFIPSTPHLDDESDKQNTYEAGIVSRLVQSIVDLKQSRKEEFDPGKRIGVIASYRRQIGLIRSELLKLQIPGVESIMVDTVERFQGAQRDIIIYSFSVGNTYQLEHLGSRIEIEGQLVDRKLNVAITRAREQLFLTGNPSILSADPTYYRLIEFIRSRSGYVDVQPEAFIKGEFDLPKALGEVDLADDVVVVDEPFSATFEELVIKPIKTDPRTLWHDRLLLGRDSDYIRLNVIEYGRADFDEPSYGFSPKEKVDLYCYFNMRKHYCTSLAIYREMADHLSSLHADDNANIVFIDVGCGPLTSGLAFRHALGLGPDLRFTHVGIDRSGSMLKKAKDFAGSDLFGQAVSFHFATALNEIPLDHWSDLFQKPSMVIFNFSYLFGNLSDDEAMRLGEEVNDLIRKFKLNKYLVVFQNSTVERFNRSYEEFKSMLPGLKVHKSTHHRVQYRNAQQTRYDPSETVYYEILQSR